MALIVRFAALAVKRAGDGTPVGFVWRVCWPLLAPGWLAVLSRDSKQALAGMPGHLEFHTAEEVDAYIREERDSWER